MRQWEALPNGEQSADEIHFGISSKGEVNGLDQFLTGQGVGDGLGLLGVVAHVVDGLRLSAARPIKACQQ